LINEKCIKEFQTNIEKNLESIQLSKNQIESEIKNLQEVKNNIEKAAQKTIDFYLKIILLISIAHVSSFYYMIFEVDWLGWDIIEPITYTV
jgi:hypothetical protein